MIEDIILGNNLKEGSYSDNVTYYHSQSPIDFLLYDSLFSRNNIILNRQHIRVLTYNIFLRPPGIKNNESDHKDDRLNDFIRIIHNYDIICLQELFGSLNSRKEKLIKVAVSNGFFFFVQDNEPSYFSKYCSDGGILILSRFPIVLKASHAFSYGVGSDAIAQKGIIYAKISIGDSYLHVFNTHTQASYINEDYDFFLLSYRTRLQQIKEISEFVNSILKTE